MLALFINPINAIIGYSEYIFDFIENNGSIKKRFKSNP